MFRLEITHILTALLHISSSGYAEDSDATYAVVGGAAHLPCSISPPNTDDSVYLVLWYKDESPQPIYSYDARGPTTKHWSENHQFGSRALFRTSVDPAQLVLTDLRTTDSGVYTCRVDFRNSRTRTQVTRLECVERARKPVILDDEGVQVMGTVGPYRLSQPLILVCVGEGEPAPDLVWLRDGEVWDAEMDPGVGRTDRQRNTMVVSSLGRQHAGNTFTCQADNKRLTDNVETGVTISIHMPVENLRISNLDKPQTAGRTYEIACQAVGSSPSPSISWYITYPSGQNISLEGALTTVSMAGNLTSSRINVTLEKSHHNAVVYCVASNPMFLPVKVSSILEVNHPPEVEVHVARGVAPGRVIEGNELRLECVVSSRPPPTRFRWTKDNVTVSEEQVLHRGSVVNEDSGTYVCVAENLEGRGESSPVRVSVLYRPVCTSPVVLPHSKESEDDTPGVDLRCEVDAKPLARSYRWFFNSSGGSFEIPSAKPLMSFMNYAESESSDQGEVLCWATNDVGVQSDPCVFHVVPLGAPHPPLDCDIADRSPGSVEVACQPGFSGGLEQHFVLEVFEMLNGSQTLVTSNWSRDPFIRVTGLQANTSYILAVHAANERGESAAVYVGGQTASSHPPLSSTSVDRLPLLYIVIAVLCSVMFLSLVLSVTAACRRYALMKRAKQLTRSPPSSYGQRSEQAGEPLVREERRKSVERKVSFRECSCPRANHNLNNGSSGTLNGTRVDSRNLPTVEKTIVRSYSIDKLRARCPTCNPTGNLPYPNRGQPLSEAEHLEEAERLLKTTLQGIP